MSPEQARKLDELYTWMLERKHQQIAYPLDIASRNIIKGSLDDVGAGSTTKTQTYSVSGGAGGSITGPKAYIGTEIISVNGVSREFPYIA